MVKELDAKPKRAKCMPISNRIEFLLPYALPSMSSAFNFKNIDIGALPKV